MFTTPMTLILMIGCLAAGVVGIALVILSARRDRADRGGKPAPPTPGEASGTASRNCPRCLQFSPGYAKYCAHCGYAFEAES
ncbi:MAG: hypothetical protein IT449_09735 [Phycisphaerales bacterium]|nr:hypothetical protein [Phycisphaerales bacterium]